MSLIVLELRGRRQLDHRIEDWGDHDRPDQRPHRLAAQGADRAPTGAEQAPARRSYPRLVRRRGRRARRGRCRLRVPQAQRQHQGHRHQRPAGKPAPRGHRQRIDGHPRARFGLALRSQREVRQGLRHGPFRHRDGAARLQGPRRRPPSSPCRGTPWSTAPPAPTRRAERYRPSGRSCSTRRTSPAARPAP